ncbi:NACHT domain-containing protein [Streptomyces sp. NPDC101132]|uniref:NACHT domain-containing protein n=1 Tax=Streptomyces sp. NPDC101132 TaxID=3366110 RepID=UPI00382686AB
MAQQYDYESLGADVFQQLCQAILVAYYPDVQCFPVGMPDGGRDASSPYARVADATVYQVKFRKPTPNKLATPEEMEKWATNALEGEISKVQQLASRGAKNYVLMTNAQCSSHPDTGTRDRIQSWLDERMPIQSQVWWRDDIDRRLDSQTEIKRTYGLIRDFTGLAEMLGLRGQEDDSDTFIKVARNDARVSALLKYMMHQYERDRIVKFKQAELEPQLLDVFIDVPLALNGMNHSLNIRHQILRRNRNGGGNSATLDKWSGLISREVSAAFLTSNRSSGPAAASILLAEELAPDQATPSESRVVLEGAPGQGKSTVGQYVCQIHRARLLNIPEVARYRSEHRSSPVRLPLHVDFRDLATWLRRQDPFDIKNPGPPNGWSDTLESFLAAQIKRASGGMEFSVSDLDAVLRATPALLVLDGLDEVPDLNDRRAVVSCVNEALNRIEPFSPSIRTVATSRPSSFSKTPGFSKREYTYFTLGDLPLPQVLEYTDGWLESRKVSHSAAHEIRQVLGIKLGQPHIVDLARNPMQLAILLWLVRKKGPSLPDKRTALYREYMETFLDREAEKSAIIRDERELILDLHGYVAWELHCLAETGDSAGSISEQKLKALLKKYLVLRGHKKKKLELVDHLFTGMTDRVMVLTSRVQNTFEFEVQPLREYFAARYLYSTARTSSPGAERTGNRSDRFEALLRNPYWWNVTRFYAGFSDVGELANLVDLLEDLVQSGDDYSLVSYSREVALTLLRDQVFSQKPRAVSKVVDLISSEASVALLGVRSTTASNLSVPADSGGEEIVEQMTERLEKRIGAGHLDLDAARLLAANVTGEEIADWWFSRWSRSRTDQARLLWFRVGLIIDAVNSISAEQGHSVFEKMKGNLRFWHTVIQADAFPQNLIPEASYDSFLEAFRAGVQLHSPAAGHTSSAQGACVMLASSDHLLYLLQSNGMSSPWASIGGRDIEARMQGNGRYAQLLQRLVACVESLSISGKVRNNVNAWVDFHESLTEALGGTCPRTMALAAILGEVRSGNLSRGKAGDLCDASISPVIRARFARQRHNDLAWWARQVESIDALEDAFFVLCCVMRWAVPSVLVENAKKLEPWVKKFDPYTLHLLHSLAPPIWLRNGPEISHNWLSRSAPALAYLGSAQLHRTECLKVLEWLSGKCRDLELAGIVGAARLAVLLRVIGREWGEATDAVIGSYAAALRASSYSYPLSVAAVGISASRDLLRRAGELPPAVRHSANENLTADIARRATPLADVSDTQQWFDRELFD